MAQVGTGSEGWRSVDEKGGSDMRGRRGIIILLAVLGLTAFTLTPALAVQVGPHDVTFVTQRYDYPVSGQSTWYYTVTSNAGLGGELGCYNRVVKYVVLQLGGCCGGVVEAGEWIDYDTLLPWTSGITVEQDWATGVFGVKFNKPFQAGETRQYYFTISGNLAPAEGKIKVGINTVEYYGSDAESSSSGEELQAAPYTYQGLVYGPDLQCEHTTAIALSSFSARPASDTSVPAALVPAVLLAGLVPVSLAMVRRVRV
jgi:hypothetical protein